jgi:hypothetical protein
MDVIKANNFQTVQVQLENLNKHWVGNEVNDPILNERIPLVDDVSLIQMHLSLVEKTLRSKNCNHLTPQQKSNRMKSLDILHDYWKNGVFPKNLYHSKRTPYFIDTYGTACAVGQLIIETGHSEVAHKIQKENNYAYLAQLDSTYLEINQWATEYGFTIEELAWIQPCYCSVIGVGISHVTCYGGADGYFAPTPVGGTAPYIYQGWYWWDGTSWLSLPCGGCDLIAGDYKCTVMDAMGTMQDYFATITQPTMVSPTISFTNDDGTCNGSAIVANTGGTSNYTYSWSPGTSTNDTLTNLCAASYSVTVTDDSGCSTTTSVIIATTAGINEINAVSPLMLYPNPTHQQTILQLNNPTGESCKLSIYDAQGREIKKIITNATHQLEIETNDWTDGIYFLQLYTEKKQLATGKLIVGH